MRVAPLLAAVLVTAPGAVAAMPLPQDGFVPFTPSRSGNGGTLDPATGVEVQAVETFDPVARAQVLVQRLPRRWGGTYQSFSSGPAVPVTLQLDQVTAVGQMVDLRGQMTIDGRSTAVQGNLNAESDQLDLLLLAPELGGGLQAGGAFQGLQGLALSGWDAARLTVMGGRLALQPVAAAGAAGAQAGQQPVRGLW